jgi:hypothetical protein
MNVFNRVIGEENIDKAIEGAFSKAPNATVRRLALAMRRFAGDKDEITAANEGFVSTLIDSSIARATNQTTGVVNWRKVGNSISEELIESLHKNMVITKTQADNFRTLRSRFTEMQDAIDNPAEIADVAPKFDMLNELVVRGGGAAIATRLARNVGILGQGSQGPGLVVAGLGSRGAQQILGLDPKSKVSGILAEAVLDPNLMRQLLSMGDAITPRQAREALLTTNSILFAAGLSLAFTEEDMDYFLDRASQRLSESEARRSMEAFGF